MYNIIEIKSDSPVSHKDRKKFMKSLVGDYYKHKKGTFIKFNNAVGFSDVIDDYYSEYPCIICAKVKTPDTYNAPFFTLANGLYIDLDKNGVVKFIIKDKVIKHPNEKYTYSTVDIVVKFVNFLKKVYPMYSIVYSRKDRVRVSKFENVLNFFYQGMDFNDTCYTVECSSDRLLTEKEKFKIEGILRECVKYSFHIEQYYCETCASYHKDSPYHIEIVYDK